MFPNKVAKLFHRKNDENDFKNIQECFFIENYSFILNKYPGIHTQFNNKLSIDFQKRVDKVAKKIINCTLQLCRQLN